MLLIIYSNDDNNNNLLALELENLIAKHKSFCIVFLDSNRIILKNDMGLLPDPRTLVCKDGKICFIFGFVCSGSKPGW